MHGPRSTIAGRAALDASQPKLPRRKTAAPEGGNGSANCAIRHPGSD
jgi:hypothetical protein